MDILSCIVHGHFKHLCIDQPFPAVRVRSWLFPNYGYADPPPIRSGHLDINDAQCAKKRLGVKFHIKAATNDEYLSTID